MERFSEAAKPGRWFVDLIPPRMFFSLFLISQMDLTFTVKYIPSWFPGAHFRKFADLCRTNAREAFEKPYLNVKKQMVRRLQHPKCYFCWQGMKTDGGYCKEEFGCVLSWNKFWENTRRGRVHHVYNGWSIVSSLSAYLHIQINNVLLVVQDCIP